MNHVSKFRSGWTQKMKYFFQERGWEIELVCNPNRRIEMFFYRLAKSPLAAKLTKGNSLTIFSRWNYLCNEIRYLT